MHFDAEVVVFRMCGRNGGARFAHAKANFENLGRAAPENGVKIERRIGIGNADFRHHLVVIALLGVGDAPLAQYEAADGAAAEAILRRGGLPHLCYLFFLRLAHRHSACRAG